MFGSINEIKSKNIKKCDELIDYQVQSVSSALDIELSETIKKLSIGWHRCRVATLVANYHRHKMFDKIPSMKG